MALRLELDNVTNLPDGGPTSFEVQGRRSVDIGRNTYLDWTLPDPDRVVSGWHCEIHYRDGGYWITDISTNGTYLNGSDTRLTEPTRLRTGDRIAIGDYLVNVTVEEEDDAPRRNVEAPPEGPEAASSAALWEVPNERAAPAERRETRRAREANPVQADVLDWIADIPTVAPPVASEDAPDPHALPPTPPPIPTDGEGPAPPSADVGADDTWSSPVQSAAPAPIATLGRAAEGGATPTKWAPPPAAPDPPDPPIAAQQDGEAEPIEPQTPPPSPPPAAPGAALPQGDRVAEAAADDDVVYAGRSRRAAVQSAEIDRPVPGGFGQSAPPNAPSAGPAGPEFERFVVALAHALDVPRDRLDTGTPEEFAARLGQFVQLTISGMQRLLKARAASHGYMRRGPGTQVQAAGNNPLKFMPTPAAAADVLFGPASRSYLTLEDTLDESFADLGQHQMALYAAMQGAVERMLKDLDPEAIEASEGERRGVSLPGVSSRKSKHWDTYKERYNSRASQHDNGMVDVFMMCFSDAYERAINPRD